MNALAEAEAELDSHQCHIHLRLNRANGHVEIIGDDYAERLIAKAALKRLGYSENDIYFLP